MKAIAERRELHLAAHGVEYRRVGIADIADHCRRGTIEIAFAIRIPDVHALCPLQSRAALAVLIEKQSSIRELCA